MNIPEELVKAEFAEHLHDVGHKSVVGIDPANVEGDYDGWCLMAVCKSGQYHVLAHGKGSPPKSMLEKPHA